MSSRIWGCLLLAIMLLLPSRTMGAAGEAQDITADVDVIVTSKAHFAYRMSDRDHRSYWQGERRRGTLELRSATPMHGLYITWRQAPRGFTIQQKKGGKWVDLTHVEASPYQHQYYELPALDALRLKPERDDGQSFGISELYVLGAGALPAWVQLWKPPHEDADLLLLFAHPDDEVLFFGGLLPYYAVERKLKVLPVALSASTPLRVTELLNSLWSLGIRHYPVLAGFDDRYSWRLEEAYAHHGKRRTAEYITRLLRKHKPEVVVTHDINGEYGHGMHRLCADMAQLGVQYAADPKRFPESAAEHGTFQVQKLYLHLYREAGRDVQVVMDWDLPLPSFGGKTGFELAQAAYRLHVSQQGYEQYAVEPRDSALSSYRFGLKYSAVGEDVLKSDLFENIPTFVVE